MLNQCLRTPTRLGIRGRGGFAELPQRVEHRLSAFGPRLAGMLDQIVAPPERSRVGE